MEKEQIIEMYNKGYSIESIINMYYRERKKETVNYIRCSNGRKIIITDNVTKEKIRQEVYQIIYKNLLSV